MPRRLFVALSLHCLLLARVLWDVNGFVLEGGVLVVLAGGVLRVIEVAKVLLLAVDGYPGPWALYASKTQMCKEIYGF